MKKESKDFSKKLSAAEARLDSQKKELDKNTESIKTGKKVSENNLKYLNNLDRNSTLRVQSFASRNFCGYKLSQTPTFKIKFRGD